MEQCLESTIEFGGLHADGIEHGDRSYAMGGRGRRRSTAVWAARATNTIEPPADPASLGPDRKFCFDPNRVPGPAYRNVLTEMTDHRSGNLRRPAAKFVRDWLPLTSARDLQMDTGALSAGLD
jgi:hypothetical protein